MIPESTTPGRRVSWAALAAMVLVPLLAVGALIGLAGTGRASEPVEAAIVNLDKAVTVGDEYIPMGRQLAAAMIERDDANINWTLADAKNAKDGLATGRYSAVVTIPEEFSAAATSFSANDADEARRATIKVQVSENAPVTDAVLAQEIAALASDSVNTMLTETYLDNIYVGFNTVGEQFVTIVDAAGQLADGARQLADGTGELSNGVTQLADGMSLLSENSATLNDGVGELADGVGQLAGNTSQLTDGGSQIADGLSQLAAAGTEINSGASQLKAGGTDLSAGATALDEGVGELSSQLPQLVDGVGQLADGAEQLLGGIPAYTDGTKQVVGGVGELKGGIDQVIAGLDAGTGEEGGLGDVQQLIDGADELSAGADQLSEGAEQFSSGAGALATGAQDLADGISDVSDLLGAYASGAMAAPGQVTGAAEQIAAGISAQFQCPVDDEATCQLLAGAFAQGAGAGAAAGVDAGFKAGTGVGATALNTPDETGSSLVSGSSGIAGGVGELATGATVLGAGATEMAAGTSAIAAGAKQLAEGVLESIGEQMGQLRDGLQQLSDGAGEIVTGAQPLVDNADALGAGSTELLAGIKQLDTELQTMPEGVEALASGVSEFAAGVGTYTAGVSQLADGLGEYTGGVSELDSGFGAYVDGVGQFADGVNQLNGGVEEFVSGIGQYTGGVVSAAEGVQELSTGVVQLDEGAEQLADGLETFASEMAGGADQVPSYNQEQREVLSAVVAKPVAASDDLNSTNQVGLVALLLSAGLWLAALGAYVIVRPVPSDIVTSRAPSIVLWGRTIGVPALLAAGIGAILGIIGSAVLELSAGRAFGAVALMVAAGASFVFINHALAAWLGNVGRGIAALLLVFSIALGLTSSVPGWLSAVAGISPLQNVLELVRTWLADGSGLVGLGGAALLIGCIGVVGSYLAIATRRQMTAAQFKRRLAQA